jgi:hypothetical protein
VRIAVCVNMADPFDKSTGYLYGAHGAGQIQI